MRKPKQQGTAKIDVALHHQLNARNYAQYAAELRKKAADLREQANKCEADAVQADANERIEESNGQGYLRLAARDACGPLA
jgi:hypothetical protein